MMKYMYFIIVTLSVVVVVIQRNYFQLNEACNLREERERDDEKMTEAHFYGSTFTCTVHTHRSRYYLLERHNQVMEKCGHMPQ